MLERTEGMAAQLGGLQGNDTSDGPQGLCESLVGFTRTISFGLRPSLRREGEPTPRGIEEALPRSKPWEKNQGRGPPVAELLVQLSAKVAGLLAGCIWRCDHGGSNSMQKS